MGEGVGVLVTDGDMLSVPVMVFAGLIVTAGPGEAKEVGIRAPMIVGLGVGFG